MKYSHLVFSVTLMLFLLEILPCCTATTSTTSDTIHQGESLSHPLNIVSRGSNFELVFFTRGGSSKYYLGIRFKKISPHHVLWVANRDIHVHAADANLTLNNDGSLVIMQGQVSFTVASVSSHKGNVSAVLLDSGNLVLRDQQGNNLWESFDDPSDVWIAGMKLGYDGTSVKSWKLRAWKNDEDPQPLNYTMHVDPKGSGQLLISKGDRQYWTSGIWNGTTFSLTPELQLSNLFNFTYVSGRNTSYFIFSPKDPNTVPAFVLEYGQIKLYTYTFESQKWILNWSQPNHQCEVYEKCGIFGSCGDQRLLCQCLPGFGPRYPLDWEKNDTSKGCMRQVVLQCESKDHNKSFVPDGYLKLSNFSLPSNHFVSVEAHSAEDCKLACSKNCSCQAYAYDHKTKCSLWNEALINVRKGLGKEFFLKLAASELPVKNPKEKTPISEKKVLQIIIAVVVSLTVLTLAIILSLILAKKLRRKGKDLLSFDFGIDQDDPDIVQSGDRGVKNDFELPLFSFSSVSASTNNFSDANKLGEGGFGPVYKGVLSKGYEVAIKRLSRKSGQGWEELKNEVTLIARLQHKNLVKVLGCCIDQNEKILIYEHLPNKSLDYFLFDSINYGVLDWETRTRILQGIAQGLLYLHQYSRLQIIHRDLKASNILLDKDMNPKISDFGMARIYGGQGHKETSHIAGTYGYMAPEYALQGIFSTKSDVFSFGVLMLEILSGKKNTGFYGSNSVDLLGHAWNLWRNNAAVDLIDPLLEDNFSKTMLIRYINIALLCVQESAADRPSMSEVVVMLSNEITLPPPIKQPAFAYIRGNLGSCSSDGIPNDYDSVNGLTTSIIEAR